MSLPLNPAILSTTFARGSAHSLMGCAGRKQSSSLLLLRCTSSLPDTAQEGSLELQAGRNPGNLLPSTSASLPTLPSASPFPVLSCKARRCYPFLHLKKPLEGPVTHPGTYTSHLGIWGWAQGPTILGPVIDQCCPCQRVCGLQASREVGMVVNPGYGIQG